MAHETRVRRLAVQRLVVARKLKDIPRKIRCKPNHAKKVWGIRLCAGSTPA